MHALFLEALFERKKPIASTHSMWRRIVACILAMMLMLAGWIPCAAMAEQEASSTIISQPNTHQMGTCHLDYNIDISVDNRLQKVDDNHLISASEKTAHHFNYSPDCATACVLSLVEKPFSITTNAFSITHLVPMFPEYAQLYLQDFVSTIKKPPKIASL